MTKVKIRIVGPKLPCLQLLRLIEENYICDSKGYPRAPTRYTRTPKADYTIYVTVKGRRT
jgi:hypothetical protein